MFNLRCESTLLEDFVRAPFWAVSALPAEIFAFCVFFGPFETLENEFRQKKGEYMPSVMSLDLSESGLSFLILFGDMLSQGAFFE